MSVNNVSRHRTPKLLFPGATLVLAASYTYSVRYDMVSDGVSYLDLAGALSRGDWSNSVNSYWGPAYSFLIGLGLKLHPAHGLNEFAQVHFINYVLFIGAVAAFHYFWSCVLADSPRPTRGLVLALGYLLLITTLLPTLNLVTPDLLLAVFILLIGGLLWRWGNSGRSHYLLWVGLLLGLCYWTKSIMLLVGAITLLAVGVSSRLLVRDLRPVALASLIFLTVTAPLIATLSLRAGRFLWGESGRLTYSWSVNGNIPPDSRSIYFPPGPPISEAPRIFKVRSIPHVTYAAWFDPATEGRWIRPVFAVGPQIRTLVRGMKFYRDEFFLKGAFFVAGLFILAAIRSGPTFNLDRRLPLAVFALAPLAAYSLVAVEGRYIFGFELVLWGMMFGWALSGRPSDTEERIAIRVLGVTVLLISLQVLPSAISYITAFRQPVEKDYISVAKVLSAEGVRPGQKVAIIGSPFIQHWVKLTDTSVVAVIPAEDAPAFCSSAHSEQKRLLSQITAETQADWVVSGRENTCTGEDWKLVPGTTYAFQELRNKN